MEEKKKVQKGHNETLLELTISKGRIVRDSRWTNAYNALMREPSSGRMLKAVYRRTGPQSYKIITAYWLD